MHRNPLRYGFALIELFAILAVVAICSAMLMPEVSRAKADRTSVGCQNIGRQLMLAMHLYAADFSELLPPNEDNNNQFNGWVAGDMTIANQATNTSNFARCRGFERLTAMVNGNMGTHPSKVPIFVSFVCFCKDLPGRFQDES